MRGLVPPGVTVVEEHGPPRSWTLAPSEAAAVEGAGLARRLEFAAGRRCAHRALDRLGVPRAPLVPGADRAPRWPDGVVGSVTHCEGYRAAAVARDDLVRAVGVDAEPHAPLPDGVASVVSHPSDRVPAGAGVHHDRVVFSAKEAAYKAWFPLTRRVVDFGEVAVEVRSDGTFGAVVDDGTGEPLALDGRWLVARGLVLTAVVLAR
jgi:4'-phosphopantetheinyl transferase EntD